MPKKPVVALRARTSFAVGPDRVFRNQLVRSDNPIVEGREHLFAVVDEILGIEKATANPGERRAAKKPKNVCDTCGFEAKTAGGLTTHERSHEETD